MTALAVVSLYRQLRQSGDTPYDLAYCSAVCELADAEFRVTLEPLHTTYHRLDGIYNLSLCCKAPIDECGYCSQCGQWEKET